MHANLHPVLPRLTYAKVTINISWRRKFYTSFLSSCFWEHLEQLTWPWKIWVIKNIHLNKLCSVYNALLSLVWNKDLQIVNKHLSVTLCQRETSTKWNNCMPSMPSYKQRNYYNTYRACYLNMCFLFIYTIEIDCSFNESV